MPQPIQETAARIDISPRIFFSTTVAASPSAATETTICTLTLSNDLAIVSGVLLYGWAAFTVGTNGTACNLKIRRTDTAGATVAATGATTGGIAAAALVDMNVNGIDTGGTNTQVYVLTLTVTGGSAASTVSACNLIAVVA
jgi:hypothetical protein